MGEKQYFENVPASMWNLLLNVIIPDHSHFLYEIRESSGLATVLCFAFVFLGVGFFIMCFAVWFMTVSKVSEVEADGLVQQYLLEHFAKTSDGLFQKEKITKKEYFQLLAEPQVSAILKYLGVNMVDFANLSDSIFGKNEDEAVF